MSLVLNFFTCVFSSVCYVGYPVTFIRFLAGHVNRYIIHSIYWDAIDATMNWISTTDGNNSRGACCDTARNRNCHSSCYDKLKSIDQSIYVRAPADPLILALKFCLLGMVLWRLLLVLSTLFLIRRFFISSSLSSVASFLHIFFSYTSYIILTFIVVFFNNWTYSITRSCYYRACDAICR